MSIDINLQINSKVTPLPSLKQFQQWVNSAIAVCPCHADITIRIVDKNESAQLNQRFRQRSGATNVLSFDYPGSPQTDAPLLGDLVICADLVAKEAKQQQKQTIAHWAHLTIHGSLHLLGFDHVHPNDAKIMESQEILLLQQLGYGNPYQDDIYE